MGRACESGLLLTRAAASFVFAETKLMAFDGVSFFSCPAVSCLEMAGSLFGETSRRWRKGCVANLSHPAACSGGGSRGDASSLSDELSPDEEFNTSCGVTDVTVDTEWRAVELLTKSCRFDE